MNGLLTFFMYFGLASVLLFLVGLMLQKAHRKSSRSPDTPPSVDKRGG